MLTFLKEPEIIFFYTVKWFQVLLCNSLTFDSTCLALCESMCVCVCVCMWVYAYVWLWVGHRYPYAYRCIYVCVHIETETYLGGNH